MTDIILLNMSRIDKIINDNPLLNTTIADLIVYADPTSTYKYADFLVKQLKTNKTIDIEHITSMVFGKGSLKILNEFEEHCKANRILKNDISKHNTFLSLNNENKLAQEIIKMKELEKEVHKIYDDNEWLVLIPLSFESCVAYGSNTKWCITNRGYWDNYKLYKKIFIINKVKNTKYAIVQHDTSVRIYDEKDKEINILLLDFNDKIWGHLRHEFKKDFHQSNYDCLISYDNGKCEYILVNNELRHLTKATENQIKSFKNKYIKYMSYDYIHKLDDFLSKKNNKEIAEIISTGKTKN
jgi:hypothetical protein